MAKTIGMDELTLSVANEFSIKLILALAEKYSITLNKVFEIFDEINYWRVLNDSEVCCVLAHDGLQATLHDLGGTFNDILSRDASDIQKV